MLQFPWGGDEGWLDATGEWIEPSTLSPPEEMVARLRGYRDGTLQAFPWPAARWEQDLDPVVLPAEAEQLARKLLASPVSPSVLEEVTQGIGMEQARTILRQVVTEWDDPVRMQETLRLCLQRRHGEVLWLLEQVRIGVTGVEVRISISSPLPNSVPYQVFYPRPLPSIEDLDVPEPERLEPWWNIFGPSPLHVSDDVGTRYKGETAQVEGGFPLRVFVAGEEQARMAEQYLFTFSPGVPPAARSLTLSGTINLAIEQPLTESPPWRAEELSLGDFDYTIDLEGWWPGVIRPDEVLG